MAVLLVFIIVISAFLGAGIGYILGLGESARWLKNQTYIENKEKIC